MPMLQGSHQNAPFKRSCYGPPGLTFELANAMAIRDVSGSYK